MPAFEASEAPPKIPSPAPSAPQRRIVPEVIKAVPGAGKARLFDTKRERIIGGLIGTVLTVAAALSCFYYWPRPGFVDDATRERFAAHLDTYVDAAERAEIGAPRIVGLLLPIEPDEGDPMDEEAMHSAPLAEVLDQQPRWTVSRLYGQLSSRRLAETPEEVGTVAIIECDEREVGHYRYEIGGADSGGAYQWACQLELVHVAERLRVDRIVFYGGAPPRETTNGYAVGSHPREAIVRYLDELPQQ